MKLFGLGPDTAPGCTAETVGHCEAWTALHVYRHLVFSVASESSPFQLPTGEGGWLWGLLTGEHSS